MNIIGISGLERSDQFKRLHWPGLDEREYRMSQGQDAAAALVIDGKTVAAAAQERFDGRKHSPMFPREPIHWALRYAGLKASDIDEIAHSFDYLPYAGLHSFDPVSKEYYSQVLARDVLVELVQRDFPGFPPERIHAVSHHLAHAASAYFTSGWEDCLVVVIDGMGEVHGATIYDARKGNLEPVRAFAAHDSIGILYSLVTFHLGFDFNSDEYKIMGLAPYGNPERFRGFFESEVVLKSDGSIYIPMLHLDKTRDERENHLVSRRYLEQKLITVRRPQDALTADHSDVAAALQERLDDVVMHLAGVHAKQLGHTRVALAGGVALNCTANGKLAQSGLFEEVYIQPAAGDDGAALGAALYRAARAGEIVNSRSPTPFFGPSYMDSDVQQAIDHAKDRIAVIKFETLEKTCSKAAELIAEGKVLAWYRGRMEFGPRALGNRSILADPSHPQMRDLINKMVKKREAFRPFAPAVSIEEASKWFEVQPNQDLRYMITVVNVREEWRAFLPAITHVNGSARVQTVSRSDNPEFHALLRAVGHKTGREMVLNTSFNVKGQPIVNTPSEAIDTFLGTGIDCLFLENHMITRL